MIARYEDRPMLLLVEAYILDRLDLLDDGSAHRLAAMAPQLAQSLGSTADTWQGVVADALDLTGEFDDLLRRDWQHMTSVEPTLAAQRYAEFVADGFLRDDA